MYSIGKEVAKQLAQEFKIENENVLEDLVLQCIDKVRMNDKEVEEKEKKKIQEKKDLNEKLRRMQEELVIENDSKRKLEKEYEKLSTEYDRIAKKTIADFDQVKHKILNEASVKERLKYEKERNDILRDLQNRIDKVNFTKRIKK